MSPSPTLQTGKLRLGKGKELVQGRIAGKKGTMIQTQAVLFWSQVKRRISIKVRDKEKLVCFYLSCFYCFRTLKHLGHFLVQIPHFTFEVTGAPRPVSG